MNSGESEVTILTLPDECLREVFAHLELSKMLSLRMVCRRWRDVCDDLRRDVRILSITSLVKQRCLTRRHRYIGFPLYPSHFHGDYGTMQSTTIRTSPISDLFRNLDIERCWCKSPLVYNSTIFHGDCRKVQVETPSRILPSALLQYCGSYLREFSYHSEDGSQPAISLKPLINNGNLEKFVTNFGRRSNDQEIAEIFRTNRRLKHLRITVFWDQKFLQQLSTDYLEILEIDLNYYYGDGTVDTVSDFVAVIEETIDNSKLLKRLKICDVHDKMLPAVSRRTSLTDLDLKMKCNFPINALNSMEMPPNLRRLAVSFRNGSVTDEFLVTLTENCKLLEYIDLTDCRSLTDDGMRSLLSLQHLKTLCMKRAKRITEELLEDFSKIENFNFCRY